MSEIIRSISYKRDQPYVTYDTPLANDSTIACRFPGPGSAEILPPNSFWDAWDLVKDTIATEYGLSVEWSWHLDKLNFVWKDDEFGFKAELGAGNPDLGSQSIAIAQSSPSHVPYSLKKALLELEEAAIVFVHGASAQGNLLEGLAGEEEENDDQDRRGEELDYEDEKDDEDSAGEWILSC